MTQGGPTKSCVFCGQEPDSKTLEHVIPRWLIEMTGSPNRVVQFGFDFQRGTPRKFAFDQFRVPACRSCNGRFSELESKAKITVRKILDRSPMTQSDFDLLLDWLDKVRVGLWIAYRLLDRDRWGVRPHFHVEKRIAANDRLLVLTMTDYGRKGTAFLGVHTPAFQLLPSCFALIINDFCFFNISRDSLLSRRMGFPFPEKREFRDEDDNTVVVMRDGLKKIRRPFLRKRFLVPGVEFYQVMFGEPMGWEECREWYGSHYVIENSLDWERGKGKVFMQGNGRLAPYPDEPSEKWIPETMLEYKSCCRELDLQVLGFQNYLLANMPSMRSLSEEEKSLWRTNIKGATEVNRILMDKMRAAWEEQRAGDG